MSKAGENRGDLKAQHFVGLDEKNHRVKEREIFGLCILAGFAKTENKFP